LHEPSQLSAKKLLDIIADTCLKKRGNLIIPAFSVGRTQEIIYALNRLDIEHVLPPIDFFIDSPLSLEATEVTKSHPECFNEELIDFMKKDPAPFEFRASSFHKGCRRIKRAERAHRALCDHLCLGDRTRAGSSIT
jgi:metallo-beta-lactamase family protein